MHRGQNCVFINPCDTGDRGVGATTTVHLRSRYLPPGTAVTWPRPWTFGTSHGIGGSPLVQGWPVRIEIVDKMTGEKTVQELTYVGNRAIKVRTVGREYEPRRRDSSEIVTIRA